MNFRQTAYEHLDCARDALFELSDAVIFTPMASSLAHLSVPPVFRRRWPSVYEAIEDGRPDREALLHLYLSQLTIPEPDCEGEGSVSDSHLILAGDHTAWSLPASRTLADRTYQHKPTQLPVGRPITVGYGFSTLAWIPESQGSWALPLLHERISSKENALDKAQSQLRQVCSLLPESVRPLSLWDSQYGCAPFVRATADIEADKIMRLRPNLCLRHSPPPYSGRGRRRLHGEVFKLKDPSTWGSPQERLDLVDDNPKVGRVEVQLWRELHFTKSPKHPMTLIRVWRPEARDTKRDRKAQWLVWVGGELPPLGEWWRVYGRRFALDHWYRFAKGRLHWTLPHLSTPEQHERWSDLMPLITWELWLARDIVSDRPLPWQKAQGERLTPGRVCQGMGAILEVIGTPTSGPKVRGKSAGWPKGKPRKHRERQAVIQKHPKKPRQGIRRGGKKVA